MEDKDYQRTDQSGVYRREVPHPEEGLRGYLLEVVGMMEDVAHGSPITNIHDSLTKSEL